MISLSISRKYTGYERRRFKFLCEANADFVRGLRALSVRKRSIVDVVAARIAKYPRASVVALPVAPVTTERQVNPDLECHSRAESGWSNSSRKVSHFSASGMTRFNLSLGRADKIKEKLTKASQFLRGVLAAAEQLSPTERWRRILAKIFEEYLDGRPLNGPVPTLASG